MDVGRSQPQCAGVTVGAPPAPSRMRGRPRPKAIFSGQAFAAGSGVASYLLRFPSPGNQVRGLGSTPFPPRPRPSRNLRLLTSSAFGGHVPCSPAPRPRRSGRSATRSAACSSSRGENVGGGGVTHAYVRAPDTASVVHACVRVPGVVGVVRGRGSALG